MLREGSRDLWIGRVVLLYATASGPVSVMDHHRLRGPVKMIKTANLSSCDEWRPGVLCYVRDRVITGWGQAATVGDME